MFISGLLVRTGPTFFSLLGAVAVDGTPGFEMTVVVTNVLTPPLPPPAIAALLMFIRSPPPVDAAPDN